GHFGDCRFGRPGSALSFGCAFLAHSIHLVTFSPARGVEAEKHHSPEGVASNDGAACGPKPQPPAAASNDAAACGHKPSRLRRLQDRRAAHPVAMRRACGSRRGWARAPPRDGAQNLAVSAEAPYSGAHTTRAPGDARMRVALEDTGMSVRGAEPKSG